MESRHARTHHRGQWFAVAAVTLVWATLQLVFVTGGVRQIGVSGDLLSVWSSRVAFLLLMLLFVWHGFVSGRGSLGMDRSCPPASLLIALVILAWHHRFVQDDAFISFRYAANLADGHGLVWNVGERVEGYTNFLWTVLMALPQHLKWDPVLVSQVTGLLCALVTLLITYRMGVLFLRSEILSALSLLVLGTNYTFSSYATGGLETQLQAAFFVSATYLTLSTISSRKWSNRRLLGASFLFSGALLTRPDSVLALAVLIPFLLLALRNSEMRNAGKISSAALVVVPVCAVALVYAAWKHSYYGGVLPNTFYVRVFEAASMKTGLQYVLLFLYCYGLLPLVGVLLANLGKMRARFRYAGVLAGVVCVWFAYVVAAGGCFMEFRFVVPVLPLLVLLLMAPFSLIGSRIVKLALVLGLVAASYGHKVIFYGWEGIESIASLHKHIEHPYDNWAGIGKVMGRLFGKRNPEVIIATTAAGAIPYYSGLTTVDMHGMNDKWIARESEIVGTRPGHQKLATASYLLERGVNLVIGHPQVFPRSVRNDGYTLEEASFSMAGLSEALLPASARVIEVPLDTNYELHMLYFTPNPTVDRVIAEMDLEAHPIRREGN